MSTVADTPAGPPATTAQPDALAVEHIDVSYRVRGKQILVVRDVSFRIGRGESYGLVGESGCGKSTIALAVVRYLARNGNVTSGGISIDGRDVLGAQERRPARAAPEHRLDGLPGARAGTEPDAQGRASGRRGVRARRA